MVTLVAIAVTVAVTATDNSYRNSNSNREVKTVTVFMIMARTWWWCRAKLWRAAIPEQAPVAEDVDWEALGKGYKLAGGSIKQAVVRAATQAALRIEVCCAVLCCAVLCCAVLCCARSYTRSYTLGFML